MHEETFEFAFEVGDLVTLKAMYTLNPKQCQAFYVMELVGCRGELESALWYHVRAMFPPAGHAGIGVLGARLPESILGGQIISESELMAFPESSRAVYGMEIETE